jgi:hypothetical protein
MYSDMNLIISPEQFHPNSMNILDKKPNMIIDGNFSKIIYSTNHFILNGLLIDFPIDSSIIKKINHTIIEYDTLKTENLIESFQHIEQQMLHYYLDYFQITNKTCIYDLSDKLHTGSCKIYSSNYYKYSNNYLIPKYYIKISGIWENDKHIGLTYKIIEYYLK